MSLSNILLIPGVGQMTFRDALSLLSPYSPRLAFNFIDPANSLFQGNTLTPVTSATNPVGVVIDQTQGGLRNLGSELRANGVVGLVGTATAATYNTTTGEGACTRVDASNQSYVEFTGLASGFYRVQITNTGSVELRVRSGGYFGALLVNIAAGQTATAIGVSVTNAITITTAAVAGTATFTVTSLKYIPGNHATASSDAKRPLFNSYTLNGQSRFGALFDGGDDALTVSGFDLSDTDKVTVIAGVRKLSDAARGTICELTATIASNNGAFHLAAPNAASASYGWESKGTTLRDTVPTGFTSPVTSHLSAIGDISGDLARLIVNATATSNTGDQGTGNFSNSTLNIGGRNNAASLPFNGYLHYLFICGAIVPDSVLTKIYRGLGPRIGLTV